MTQGDVYALLSQLLIAYVVICNRSKRRMTMYYQHIDGGYYMGRSPDQQFSHERDHMVFDAAWPETPARYWPAATDPGDCFKPVSRNALVQAMQGDRGQALAAIEKARAARLAMLGIGPDNAKSLRHRLISRVIGKLGLLRPLVASSRLSAGS